MFGNFAVWDLIGKITVGAIVLRLLYSLFSGLYRCFIASALGFNANISKYGKWAVVTGSTDGIGKAYALELAKRGMDIVLISRSPYKLQSVAAEIVEKYDRETKIIDVDFTSLDIYERIRTELENLEIGVLVNNVGMSLPYPEYFEVNDEKFLKDIIACNATSVALMTKIVLPAMKERRKGIIINVASLGAVVRAPLLAMYAATKAFVTNLSESLVVELQNTGVEMQCLIPGYVVSNMSHIKRSSFAVPSAADYVNAALASAGVESMTAGYYYHNLQIYAIECCNKYLPEFLLSNIIFSKTKSMRNNHLKKRATKK